jgi:hypothetical protein
MLFPDREIDHATARGRLGRLSGPCERLMLMRTRIVGFFASLILALAALSLSQGCSKSTDSAPDSGANSPETAEPAPGSKASSPADARARLQTVNNLAMLALAMHTFHEEHEHFPPADGSAMPKLPALAGLSYRAYLLPYLDTDSNLVREKDVYQKLLEGGYPLANDADPSERWNRPGLTSLRLDPFFCNRPGKTSQPWLTCYRVFVGGGAAFERGKLTRMADFPDGTSKTILIVEAREVVPWPKPEELDYDPAKRLPKLGGTFPDGFYAAFADARVRFIPWDTEERTIRALITRNGGEQVELPPKVDTEALRKAARLP